METAGAGETDTSAKAKQDTPTAPTPAPAAAPASSPEAKGVLTPVGEAGFATAHASPSVRAFARALGVDLAKVPGKGRKGRILRADVTAAFKAATEKAAPAASGGMGIPPIPVVDFSKFGKVEAVEMSRIKKISGPALHRSWLNIPHVTHHEEADITGLDA